MSEIDFDLKTTIEKLRKKLIDLSKKNNLISYKFEKGRYQVKVVDEVPSILFSKLVNSNIDHLTLESLPNFEDANEDTKEFKTAFSKLKKTNEYIEHKQNSSTKEFRKFVKIKKQEIKENMGVERVDEKSEIEIAKIHDINCNFELLRFKKNIKHQEKHVDSKIQTLLFQEDLEDTANGIIEKYKEQQSELGINSLYLAFGFLEWYENKNSEEPILSPLILLPIDIEKEKNNNETFKYTIYGKGEEFFLNIALKEKLHIDFGIKLPEPNENISDNLINENFIEEYFLKIENIIQTQKDWSIKNYLVMDFFKYSKMSMYTDFSPDSPYLKENENIVKLFASINTENTFRHTLSESIISKIDKKSYRPLHVTDMDSSQEAALVEIMKGENLVIEGPPGTGKSQTITNIIAAALDKNKKVLFVAEKIAALEVVKKRLDKLGLGTFCLELHSHKTKKNSFIDQIKERLDSKSKIKNVSEHEKKINEHNDLSTKLDDYVEMINSQISDDSGLTIRDCIGLYSDSIDKLPVEIIKKLKSEKFNVTLPLSKHRLENEEYKLLKFTKLLEEFNNNAGNVSDNLWFEILSINSFKNFDVSQKTSDCLKISQMLDSINCVLNENEISNYYSQNISIKNLSEVINVISSIDENIFEKVTSKEIQMLSDSSIVNRSSIDLINGSKTILEKMNNILNIKLITSSTVTDVKNDFELLKKFIENNNTKELLNFKEVTDREFNYLLNLESDIEKTTISFFFKHKKIEHLHFFYSLLSLNVRPQIINKSLLNNNLSDVAKMIEIFESKLALAVKMNENINSKYYNFDYTTQRIEYDIDALEKANILSAMYDKQVKEIIKETQKIRKFGKINSVKEALVCLKEIKEYIELKREVESDIVIKEILLEDFNGLKTQLKNIRNQISWLTALDTISMNKDQYCRYFSEQLKICDFEFYQNYLYEIENLNLKHFIELSKEIYFTEKYSDLHEFTSKISEIKTNFYDNFLKIRPLLRKDDINFNTLLDSFDLLDKYQTNLRIFSKTKLYAELLKIHEVKLTDLEDKLNSDKVKFVAFDNLMNIKVRLEDSTNIDKEFIYNLFNGIDRLDIKDLTSQISSICNLIISFQNNFSIHMLDKTLIEVTSRFKKLSSQSSTVANIVELINQISDFNSIDVENYSKLLINGMIPLSYSVTAYKFIVLNHFLSTFNDSNKIFRNFSGTLYDQERHRFSSLDKNIMENNINILLKKLNNTIPPDGNSFGKPSEYSELSFISHEISKKTKHKPICKFFDRATEALLSMKPVVMMSPLSVSSYLHQNSNLMFDLVIIDEASQLKVEDSIVALMRGKQFVIVGDSNQLPPTTFFSDQNDIESNEEDEVSGESEESILDLASKSCKKKSLLWHYRSKHESLIEFSNDEIYNGRLKIFPTSQIRESNIGLEQKFCRGIYKDKKNIIEANTIIDFVCEYISKYPDRSLGVVTMNSTQKEYLHDRFERLKNENRVFSEYVEKHEKTLEPFFVKNLENIQGDERASIIISTVYGPSVAGDNRVMQRFGPISGQYGHRRLNVIATRARLNTVVVTSLKHNDIEYSAGKSLGIKFLKGYLEFSANAGTIKIEDHNLSECDSVFEENVKKSLTKNGIRLVSQVGVKGFKIDFGVIDPQNENRYLFGLECDGAAYHSSKSARDRDIIRQKILEDYGWKILRIWSTDWFRNRDKQIERVINYYTSLNLDRTVNSETLDSNINKTIALVNNEEIKNDEVIAQYDLKKLEDIVLWDIVNKKMTNLYEKSLRKNIEDGIYLLKNNKTIEEKLHERILIAIRRSQELGYNCT